MQALQSADVPPDVKAFLGHWLAARKGNSITPEIGDYLDLPPFAHQRDTAIVDVTESGAMRYRLFGGGLNDLSGDDLTGRDVLAHFHPAARDAAAQIVLSAVATPCGYLLERTMRRGPFEFTASGIGLPLRTIQYNGMCIVGFTSSIAKRTDIASSDENAFVTRVNLIRWIDIGASTP